MKNASQSNPPCILLFEGTHGIEDFLKYFNEDKEIFKKSFPPNGESVLHLACAFERKDVVSLILYRGIDVNIRDQNGNTPLHRSVQIFNIDLLITLLEKKPDLNAENTKSETPLHLALVFGNTDAALLLLKKGANFNKKNKNFDSPIHLSCLKANESVLRALLEMNASPMEFNKDGNNYSLSCIRLLAERGVKVLSDDIKLAFEHGFVDIWEYLKAEQETQLSPSKPDIRLIEKRQRDQSTLLKPERSSKSSERIKKLESELRKNNEEQVLNPKQDFSNSEHENEKSEKGKREKSLFEVFTDVKIEVKDLSLKKEIGRGSFSKVYKGLYFQTPVAIKNIEIDLKSPVQKELLHKEISLLMNLRHPNIIRFLGVSFSKSSVLIVTEYMKRKSLSDVLPNKSIEIQELKRIKILCEIAQAMTYLHSQSPPVLHRDLKPENCLCDQSLNIKLADFGISKLQEGNNYHTLSIGTTNYMAPEFVSNQTCSRGSDVYSFAIIMWEVWYRKTAFQGMNAPQIAYFITQGKRPALEESCPEKLTRLISECWHKDSESRPDFSVVLYKLREMYKEFKKMSIKPSTK